MDLSLPSITQQHLLGLALHFFNLWAHYLKSLGHTANQRQELGFAWNTRNQKWMIPGRDISSTRSPREYCNLQSKALFNIYLALHLLHFSLLRGFMEGAVLLFGTYLKWCRTAVSPWIDAITMQKWVVEHCTFIKLCTSARIIRIWELTWKSKQNGWHDILSDSWL